MSCLGHWGSEIEVVVCAKILHHPLLIWSTADGFQLHPVINYSPTARLFTQRIIHISYLGLNYNALIYESDQTSLLLSQQVFNTINNSRSVATPTDHPHPTPLSDNSGSEHLACPPARQQSIPTGRPADAHATNNCAHDPPLVPDIMPHRPSNIPDAAPRQQPPSIYPQKALRQKLTMSNHTFTSGSTASPDPSYTLNPDSPRLVSKQLHRRSESQLRFGTDAHRVKRRRKAQDRNASV
jgi:hypothetical protein